MKIGIIGSGQVGEALANGLLGHGHAVMRGTREPAKLDGWRAGAGDSASVGTLVETARFGELVILAVKGNAAVQAVQAAGLDNLRGKVVIDTTNPLADSPPDNGVLRVFTNGNDSLMEQLQKAAPEVRFVKAFSCVGSGLMINPILPGGRPTMFICGNDTSAKQNVAELLLSVGWESEDCGPVEAARAIEPLAVLWCIPGFLRNDWVHAFKMLRP
jgi:8-hydroxy-5-deazaflavin:NADPH oxidoreductase